INPFWVVTLTFPVVWMWGWLNRRNLEPSTPAKMMLGMFLVGVSFALLHFVARAGETQEVTPAMLAGGDFRFTDRSLTNLEAEEVPAKVLDNLKKKDDKDKFIVKGHKFATDEKSTGQAKLTEALEKVLTRDEVQ